MGLSASPVLTGWLSDDDDGVVLTAFLLSVLFLTGASFWDDAGVVVAVVVVVVEGFDDTLVPGFDAAIGFDAVVGSGVDDGFDDVDEADVDAVCVAD